MSTNEPTTQSIEEALELGKKAFALKKYEKAVDHYATALELATAKHGDNAPELADLYFAYGKALLENAIAQSSVLGKDGAEEAVGGATEEETKPSAFLSFSGDPEDTVDLLNAPQDESDNSDDEDEDEEGEPEDDFNAAWEVLDLARALYEKQVSSSSADDGDEEGVEVKLKLAETYIALGDVSLETEKFPQATTDYTSALSLKSSLLPPWSRQIAEVHYKLCIVLDLSSGRLEEAIGHAERALESVEGRLAVLREAQQKSAEGKAAEGAGSGKAEANNGAANGSEASVGQPAETAEAGAEEGKKSEKGKGKAKAHSTILPEDDLQNLSAAQLAAEVRELEGLRGDLGMKIEELKTIPTEPGLSAPALVAQSLDQELGLSALLNPNGVPSLPPSLNGAAGGSGGSGGSANGVGGSGGGVGGVVNDLTGVVKKKKKAVPATEEAKQGSSASGKTEVTGQVGEVGKEEGNKGKRKAEDDDAQRSPVDKKAKLESGDATSTPSTAS